MAKHDDSSLAWWEAPFRYALLAGNYVIIALLLISYSAAYIPPSRISIIGIIALGYPIYAILGLLFIGYWAYKRDRQVYSSFGIWILGVFHFINWFGVSMVTLPPNTATEKIMTYNVHYFNAPLYHAGSNELAASQSDILNRIIIQKPAIFCGQEYSGKTQSQTASIHQTLIEKTSLNHSYRAGGSSLAIYSQYPILDTGILNFKGTYNGAIYADIKHPKGKIRVYNIHLQSIGLGADSEAILDKKNISSLNKEETQQTYKRVGSKLSDAFLLRTEQARAIAAHIEKSPHPVIVCGDMNDTPISYAYSTLTAKIIDTFWACGWGRGSTYAGVLPGLRIDYILVDTKFTPFTHTILREGVSDHYAVLSQVALNF